MTIASFTTVPFFGSFNDQAHILIFASIVAEFLTFGCLLFLNKDETSFILYMILVGGVNFFYSFPYSRIVSNELLEKVNSEREKYLVLNFTRFIRELFAGVCLLSIGILMKKSKNLYIFRQ